MLLIRILHNGTVLWHCVRSEKEAYSWSLREGLAQKVFHHKWERMVSGRFAVGRFRFAATATPPIDW
jgi:hypothetical protein